MENNVTNATCTSTTTNLRQQQQSQAREPSLTQKLQDQHMQQQQQQQQQQQMHQQTSNTGSNSINNNSNNIENQQQFCLRWHNHQTSLLSTLPILLDQSHLTDVTISAEGRTLRAHRVVLSACSSFFLEIFRTLETTHHPVIIIPGASFAAIVALLTFMYSGEVNVYEEQIPVLLSLAETLGIKGLADVHNNLQKLTKVSQDKETLTNSSKEEPEEKSPTPPSPQATQSACGNFSLPQTPITAPTLNTNLAASAFNPLLAAGLNTKFPSPLENFFLKSLQFYPNLMHQPLNFSQAALNKTSELLTKYQQQCNLYQTNMAMNAKDILPNLMHSEDEGQMAKRFCAGLTEKKSSMQQQQQHLSTSQQINLQQQQKDIKRIDKIVENLRGAGGSSSSNTNAGVKHEKSGDTSASSALSSHLHSQLSPLSIKTSMENFTTNPPNSLMASKSSIFSSPTPADSASQLHSQLQYNISAEDQLKLQQHLDKYAQSCARTMEAANESLKNDAGRIMGNEKLPTATAQSPQTKTPSNSKLYATCFICHKQLSNQYNLRVHLETHQNVRYACNVCSHVSRSKDALRKHVSYRHPGAPSPCETEARRKRANKVLATQLNVANLAQSSPSSGEITPTSPNTLAHFQAAAATSNTAGNELNCGGENAHGLTAAQLTSAYQMFMPNQFHLAAVAAQQQQQQQQQLQQQQCSPSNTPSKDFNNSLTPNSTTDPLIKTENGTALSEANSKLSLSTNTNQVTTTTTTPTTTTTTQTTMVSNSNTLTTAMEFQNSPNPTNNSGENRLSPSLNP